MEVRHLKYFVAVAEELHFGRASERVGIAQPPFSQQIKKLEEEIGVPLLWRSKRHVELTAAGKVFLVEARKILAEAGKAADMARGAARGEIGQLSVGFVSSALYGEFTPVFRIMRARHPEVALALQDMTSEEQVRAMKDNKLDVGLVRPPVPGAEGLAFEVVLREPFVVVLPKNHALARQKSLAVNDLAQESFLMVPRSLGPGFYDQIIQLCAQSGFAPKVSLEISSAQTIVSLIAGGMGVSLVPYSLQHLRRTGVVYRPLKPPAPKTELAVMWRAEDSSPAVSLFLGIIREVAKGSREQQASCVVIRAKW
ncbi:MAG: LysR family transcriptional regulator [Verrucomicrobiota bacterium]|jgi:DNA-binding transcriptional LysR family regulator